MKPLEDIHGVIAGENSEATPGAAAAEWKLVPVEPTAEMLTAYLTANDAYWRAVDSSMPRRLDKWRNGTPSEATAESYRAMLAAAPTPLQAEMQKSDQVHFAAPQTEAKSLQPLLDAERYRWLRDHSHTMSPADNYKPWCAQVARDGRSNELLTGDDLDAAVDAALGNRTPARQEAERECETCRGVGTMDERLGGEFFSNPAATCPDCDGKGWWVATPRKQGTQATGEDPDTFAPETRAVMEKLRPIVAERLGMAASGESESAAPLPVQGKDTARYHWMRDWLLQGRPRYEIMPVGHIKIYSPEEIDEAIDAALRASSAPTTKG